MRPIDNNLVDPQHSWKPRLTTNIANKDSPSRKSYQAVTVDKRREYWRKCYEGVFAYELLVFNLNESRKGDQDSKRGKRSQTLSQCVGSNACAPRRWMRILGMECLKSTPNKGEIEQND
ncbi:732e5d3d-d9a4-4232-a0d9-b6dca2d96740-CDS [Sclerotinia trifoliorum]|uniref:732e5d3d-d9a4-4232-a0d9-b6dca2d96740-CDS n=1 Tax=Sclerotinia trifoliorum TaxID=28548 RepID=A0A8H2VRN3_9HELO|nr:732e5d3d-d9a4-4232-a0d9-b6dca2d96740-CDS [Sclerotinia trifoliorum]